MESEFLYRYISFETFVGMVQKNALTLVLPSEWDDPQENSPFEQFVAKIESDLEQAFFVAMHNKIYAQSWSELSESDAMWRIYAYNNRAVRIKISKNKLDQLDEVKAVPVIYSDEAFDCKKIDERAFFSSLAYKRTAFSHEKEVRIIKRFRYRNTEDAELHIKALMVVNEHPQMRDVLDSVFPEMTIEEKVKELVSLLNVGKEIKKTYDVSFSQIPDFIEGVLVHPMAPEWYVDVVREFCVRNNVPFEGKSKLYT